MALVGRRSLAVALGLVLVAAGWSATAQTPTRAQPFPEIDNARRWGPFMGTVRFSIDNIGYDSNVYLTPEGYGQATTDLVARMGPVLNGQIGLGHRAMLMLKDKLEGEVFLRNPQLNHTDNTFDGQFDVVFGPLLLTTTSGVVTRLWRPSSEVTDRTRENDLHVTETARLFLGPRTDVSVSEEISRYRYSNPDPLALYTIVGGNRNNTTSESVSIDVALNRDDSLLTGEFGWRIRPLTRVFLTYQRRKTVFQFATNPHDATENRALVGVELNAISRLSGRFALGRTSFRGDIVEFNAIPYDGPVAEASLIYRPTGSTRLTAQWIKTLYFSTFQRNLYYIDNLLGLAADSYLGVNWGLQAGCNVRDSRYPEVSTWSVPDPAHPSDSSFDVDVSGFREDHTTDAYAGVLFRLKGGFEIGLRYGRMRRTSNYPPANNQQSYFSTTGSYAF